MRTETHWPKWMGDYPRANLPWSEAEDNELLEEHRDGVAWQWIARQHGRTLIAIQSRLEKLEQTAPRFQGKTAEQWHNECRYAGKTAYEWFDECRNILTYEGKTAEQWYFEVRREVSFAENAERVLKARIETLEQIAMPEGKTAEQWRTLYHHKLDDTENAERGMKARVAWLEGVLRGIKNAAMGA